MNRQVNAISGRLSLRQPQRDSLEILDRVYTILPPDRDSGPDSKADLAQTLDIVHSEYPTVTDFERDFPSLCFALATGVGKTRLMGAFISYLYLAHDIRNFFILAPNLTIYNKLIGDFTPGNPKYVFKGIAEFATHLPEIITGDNYEQRVSQLNQGSFLGSININIFNISKINSEVRGGKSPKIKRLSEYIGESYFQYLANLDDLVLIMDESHRYRAQAGMRAINDLKPILGLELTATPFIESTKGPKNFQNVIYDYPLGRAIDDGFVKDPAVVTRKDFSPKGRSPAEIERMKILDGVRLHESIKVELTTYARETNRPIVKPFVLVIARDTTHAAELLALIESDDFFAGRYKGKVIQVDSSTKGKKEDEMIDRLLQVESRDEPTEIVIHVNMLKEGWDVTNLYTIIPLRAANARTLVEQSIGRGLRLPYGLRTGVDVVDRLNIIAHDRFQEIIDDSKQDDSPIQKLQHIELEAEDLDQDKISIISQPNLASQFGSGISQVEVQAQSNTADSKPSSQPIIPQPKPLFKTPQEQEIARFTYQAVQDLAKQPKLVPTSAHLSSAAIQAKVKEKVIAQYAPQLGLEGVEEEPDLEAVIAQATEAIVQQTIDIPRIVVVPTGEVITGFNPFTLNTFGLSYNPPSEELWAQSLKTGQRDIIGVGADGITESRLENYVVAGLIDLNDISYDDHADLLYELAQQVVVHFAKDHSEEDCHKILRFHQRAIAKFVHAQMQEHFWEKASGYEVQIKESFSELKDSAYTTLANKALLDYRRPPDDKSNMAKYLFIGFAKCLYNVQKFDSNTERILAIILERDALKWFRPAKGQFQLYYRWLGNHPQYQPDFVAETEDAIYMLEPKARNQLDAPEVLAKRDAAVEWCQQATTHMLKHGGKPWTYALIPHDSVQESWSLKGLVEQFQQTGLTRPALNPVAQLSLSQP